MNPPKISVLIPTYNYARFLPEAIESVLAQDFRDFELLIADDCSTDHTAEVVPPYAKRDPRLRFAVNTTNLGMVQNWQHCLDEARGEYVKYLFGDDILTEPQALGKLAALLDNHPSAALASSARQIVDEDSQIIGISRPLPEGCHPGRNIIAKCLMEDANLIGEPSAVMFRQRDARRGFDPKLRQVLDLEFWFHLLEKGDLAYTRQPLCAFRQHGGQQSAVNDASGQAWNEHRFFFTDCATQAWVPSRAKFRALFALRRALRRKPAMSTPELREQEARLAGQLGERNYFWRLICYKLAKPFHNLHRSVNKRITFNPSPSSRPRPGKKGASPPNAAG